MKWLHNFVAKLTYDGFVDATHAICQKKEIIIRFFIVKDSCDQTFQLTQYDRRIIAM
jgi:hypothetical protein